MSHGVRLLIEAVLAAGLLLFLAPIFAGIFNLGNGVGIAFFAAAELVFVLWGRISPLLKIKPVKIAVIAVTAVAAVLLLLAMAISVYMIKCAANSPVGSADAVIVLGCRVKGSKPSHMLEGRINAAYRYLCDNPKAVCILSGGQGSDELISEADCMFSELTRMGIPQERLYREDKSTDTYENIRNSEVILRKLRAEGIISGSSAVIVTNEYHQCRAKLIARKQGIEAYAVSAASTLWLLPTYWVRECFGVAYEIVF